MKETNTTAEKRDSDFEEWLNAYDFHGVCRRCTYIREIFGKYRDPDDEWRAMDEICNKCPKEVVR